MYTVASSLVLARANKCFGRDFSDISFFSSFFPSLHFSPVQYISLVIINHTTQRIGAGSVRRVGCKLRHDEPDACSAGGCWHGPWWIGKQYIYLHLLFYFIKITSYFNYFCIANIAFQLFIAADIPALITINLRLLIQLAFVSF